MGRRTTRRQFLQTTSAAGMGYWVAGRAEAGVSKSANGRIQVGCIGVGGKGDGDSKMCDKLGKVVAACDVDSRILERAATRFKAKQFADFREMLDQMGDQIDAVTVSTPDHVHVIAAARAMRMGKHCYCQKPLTRSIAEARLLAETARDQGVATQMGNQYTAFNGMRKMAYQVRAGQLGKVSEVHIWTNRPVWPQGEARGAEKPIPDRLNWDLWVGPAPMRPYSDGYHQFKWRGWWDFGTGALGDMACHTANMPFMALNMRDPVSVQATTSGHNKDSYPSWSKIKFEFPELNGRDAFTMYWYDGTKQPSADVLEGVEPEEDGRPIVKSGALIVGEKGKLYAKGDYAERGSQWIGVEPEEVDYPKVAGGKVELRHYEEWFNAMSGGDPATSNFPDYSAPLTETILLGNLAVWAADLPESPGKKVQWDAKNLRATNAPELQAIVRPEYRTGWNIVVA